MGKRKPSKSKAKQTDIVVAGEPNTPKKTVGRPTKFSDTLTAKILELVKIGKTVQEIAEITGVGERTLYTWCNEKGEFRQTIRQARQLADQMVESALFQRAVGYKHKATKLFLNKYRDEKGDWKTEVIEHEYVEHYPPSEIAGIFWLKNRQPDRWKDKPPEGSDPDKNNNTPTEVVIEFQDETPHKDAK